MITLNHPIYHAARITIECQSPLSIKDDEADPTLDVTLFRDAHGNPTIAGTSIAGVLNHLAEQQNMPREIFGKSANIGDDKINDNHASLLQCSFGFVHDQNNQPIMGSIQSQNTNNDDISDFLNQVSPILRDQVKITEYGATADQGKFDISGLPKGTRFTFELGLAGKRDEHKKTADNWQQLLEIIHSPLFRLGGQSQRGFGQLKVINIQQQKFDFTQSTDIQNWHQWHQQNWQNNQQVPITGDFSANHSLNQQICIELAAEDFWRIGEGNSTLQENDIKEPDAKPYTETIITWKNNQATLTHKQLVVPATGIKGALRHRILYHLRLAEQDWQGKITDKDLAPLFGIEAIHSKDKDKNQGSVSAIIINDIYPKLTAQEIPNRTKVMMHNAIDRFTGGTITGALFSEELIYQGELQCQITFNPTRFKKVNKKLMDAFVQAITDLGEGRLPLGAGSSKGHGYFNISNLSQITAQLNNISQEYCQENSGETK